MAHVMPSFTYSDDKFSDIIVINRDRIDSLCDVRKSPLA